MKAIYKEHTRRSPIHNGPLTIRYAQGYINDDKFTVMLKHESYSRHILTIYHHLGEHISSPVTSLYRCTYTHRQEATKRYTYLTEHLEHFVTKRKGYNQYIVYTDRMERFEQRKLI